MRCPATYSLITNGPSPAIVPGGVVMPQALANVFASSAACSWCFGRIGTLSSIATPGANGAGIVITTVRGSGVETCSGLPCTITPDARELSTVGSYNAWKVKATSAEVNGVPSENVTPPRRTSVNVRPSGDTDQRSASHGSGSPVTRLIRTSGACTSMLTASTGAWFPLGANRLNFAGSLRMDAVRAPPRAEPVETGAAGSLPRLQAPANRIAAMVSAQRECRATLELTGQLLGRCPLPQYL